MRIIEAVCEALDRGHAAETAAVYATERGRQSSDHCRLSKDDGFFGRWKSAQFSSILRDTVDAGDTGMD